MRFRIRQPAGTVTQWKLADLHLTYVKEIERVRVCRPRARKRKRFIGETFYVRVTSVVSPIRRLRCQSND